MVTHMKVVKELEDLKKEKSGQKEKDMVDLKFDEDNEELEPKEEDEDEDVDPEELAKQIEDMKKEDTGKYSY